LAAERSCVQVVEDSVVRWLNRDDGRVEAQFLTLTNLGNIDAIVGLYDQIRDTVCPVTFVFVRSGCRGLYDIFRLSARSYLEHHNQVKASIGARAEVKSLSGRPTKELNGLRWVPRWASHVGCIKGCLDYLGVETSDAWLFGATGHAFVLNISPGLCPSGPTDWDTSRFLRLGRNLGYVVDKVDEYCPRQGSGLRVEQEKAWKHVRTAIAQGLPCYGWELDIPEYAVIYGHDRKGYYIRGPGCEEGKGPMPWRDLGRSEIAQVLVASVHRVAAADDLQTVREALVYALDLAHNRPRWTDRSGGLAGYETWIQAMEQGRAGRFGLGYNAEVWAESRRFAVEFLREARQRLSCDFEVRFEEAIQQYEVVARELRTVSDTYPFRECDDERVAVDEQSRQVVEALRQARGAEERGLTVLAALVEQM
jgi:hypothetical protein